MSWSAETTRTIEVPVGVGGAPRRAPERCREVRRGAERCGEVRRGAERCGKGRRGAERCGE
eukprot:4372814-Alexandrium_andersonii.AAC.1